MTERTRRRLGLLAPLVVALSLFAAPSTPAFADPDSFSGSTTINQVLEISNRKYVQAKAAVDHSVAAQQALAGQIKTAEQRRDALRPQAEAIAAQQYQTGRLDTARFLLGSDDSGDFLARAVSLDEINTLQDRTLHDLDQAIEEVASKKAALDTEVRTQRANLVVMSKQKEAADKAFDLIGGESLTQGSVVAKSPVAAPAPRNSQGGFSPEPCTVDDPTTGGCITARMLHLYQEVKKAGFHRFVGCHRDGGPFEHPKGRACDWSLQSSGFSVAHNADMKNYGNNLMAFLVRNADRLGIYYVIWYAQIWFPATGWKAYHGESNHKDHVHVSVL